MFTLNQALSSIVAVDLGAKDTSHGDLLAFGTAFTSDDDVLASTDAEPYSALTIEHALPYLTLPYLTALDVGVEGVSAGDVLAFDAEITSTEGAPGKLIGLITTLETQELDDTIALDRAVNLVFDFGNANTLVIGGKSVCPSDDNPVTQFAKNTP